MATDFFKDLYTAHGGPLKASGPDGFPARFLQCNWETLKGDVTRVVRGVFCFRKNA
jgi:hypothetical protein